MTRISSHIFLCFILSFAAFGNTLSAASERSADAASSQVLAQSSTTRVGQANGTTEKNRIAILGGQALFKSAAAELQPEGYAALNKLVADLERFDSIMSIRVIGHTDSIGSAESNLRLSYKRALTIKRHLANYFPNVNLVATGAGETQPIALNSTVEGRQRNRRVEIQIIAR
jgi:outer membrane protein OmpA-like peptidoglycan-associated protein